MGSFWIYGAETERNTDFLKSRRRERIRTRSRILEYGLDGVDQPPVKT